MFKLDRDTIKSVHFIAICGTGMTALAGMLKSQGLHVTGSDEGIYPPMSIFLQELGIPVYQGYDEKHLEPKPDLVIIGNSMSRGNPEVEAVLERKLYYMSLPFALREFFIRGNYSCVVTGTHGKTTTSSLLAWVLESAGKDPGFFIGGIPENFGQGYKLGRGGIFVSEGDEYDSAFFDKVSKFLHYLPDLVILNNIEFDHADIFANVNEIEVAFSRLIRLIPRNGFLISCWDDALVRKLSEKAFTHVVRFGFDIDAHWRVENIQANEHCTDFDVIHKGKKQGSFTTPLHGLHMVKNSLAVVAAGQALGLSLEELRAGIRTFKNVRRRLQFKGEARGVRIFDDFAHHPTEVKATISALRSRFPQSKVWAVFEPRTSTSKRKIFEQSFAEALAIADHVILTPLYRPDKVPANELISLENICEQLGRRNIPNHILAADGEMVSFLKEHLQPGDVILFMSNGDFKQIPDKLIREL